jgi:hypothetical protein
VFDDRELLAKPTYVMGLCCERVRAAHLLVSTKPLFGGTQPS